MIFERIWTALFAGASAAVPATLCLAAMGSTIDGIVPFSREGLSPTVLCVWAGLSLACALPRRARNQWIVSLWLCIAFLVTAGLLFGLVARAPIPLATCAVIAVLLAVAGRQLGKVGS